jgi:hypothetical protein
MSSIFVDGGWTDPIPIIDGTINLNPDDPDSIPISLSDIPEEWVRYIAPDEPVFTITNE